MYREILTCIILATSLSACSRPKTEPVKKQEISEPAVKQWPLTEKPSINGVFLDTSIEVVLKKLGKPMKQTAHVAEVNVMAGMEDTKEFFYDGLLIGLNRLDPKLNHRVWSMQVTGNKWTVSPGLKVGMDRESVIKLIGEPISYKNGNKETLIYYFGQMDSGISLIIEKGIVTSIGVGEDYS